MKQARFHCDPLPEGGSVELSTAEAHHAMHVLRLGAGADVDLFDGLGRRAGGRIAEARHGRVRVEIVAPVIVGPRPRPEIHLAFAAPKGKRLDWLLEKATELGASSLAAVRFDRSVAGAESLSDSTRERWLGHCIAAAKQCGLDFLPEIRPSQSLSDFLRQWGPGDPARLVGELGEDAVTLRKALTNWRDGQRLVVLVGPEGGFTAAERDAIVASAFTPVRLGATALRIETAAIALLAGAIAMRDSSGD